MRLTAAFEEFLLNYKSTQTDLDIAATDAFQDLNIDGDGTSDEYDFMDDVAGGKEARRPLGEPPEARRKYMDMLQRVADRQLNQVTIELDDLDNVSLLESFGCTALTGRNLVREELWRGYGFTTGRLN